MNKILLLFIGLTIISCSSGDENIVESACPCEFKAKTTELFPVTNPDRPEYSGFGPKVIGTYQPLPRYPYESWKQGFFLPYPCQEYIGRTYEVDTPIYFEVIGDFAGVYKQGTLTYSFKMTQEWINAINSSGSIDGWNLTLKDCLESDYESN